MFARKCKPFAAATGGTITVDNTASGGTSGSNITDHEIAIPAGDTGDIIIVLFAVDGAPSVTHTGYTSLISEAGVSEAFSLHVLYRTATGSDALTIVTGNTEESAHITLRVSASSTPSWAFELTETTTTTTTHDTPSLTLGASADALWLQVLSLNNPVVSALQDGDYTDLGYARSATGTTDSTAAMVAAAYKITTAQTVNPSGWTTDDNKHNIVANVAMYL